MAPLSATDAAVTSTEAISVKALMFDHANPRLVDAGISKESTQLEILEVLWRDFAVDEIALSIAANGFFRYEPLFVAEEEQQLIVIEGNRRLAAVKLLLESQLRQAVGATDLPRAKSQVRAELQTLPIIRTSRRDVWQYVGFKHVNGPQAWDSFSKAEYIAHVHNDFDVALADIAKQIGDKHATVERLYRALMALRQAENAEVFHLANRFKRHFSFSHLYVGLDYAGIQEFIGLRRGRYDDPHPVPKARLEALGEVLTWLYGNKLDGVRPVVQSQNPDLRQLAEVLRSNDATAALRQGLPLEVSLDFSRGEDVVFREALVAAKSNLQKARGVLLKGYQGERDLMETAGDIADLATDIVVDMQSFLTRRRKGTGRSGTKK